MKKDKLCLFGQIACCAVLTAIIAYELRIGQHIKPNDINSLCAVFIAIFGIYSVINRDILKGVYFILTFTLVAVIWTIYNGQTDDAKGIATIGAIGMLVLGVIGLKR